MRGCGRGWGGWRSPRPAPLRELAARVGASGRPGRAGFIAAQGASLREASETALALLVLGGMPAWSPGGAAVRPAPWPGRPRPRAPRRCPPAPHGRQPASRCAPAPAPGRGPREDGRVRRGLCVSGPLDRCVRGRAFGTDGDSGRRPGTPPPGAFARAPVGGAGSRRGRPSGRRVCHLRESCPGGCQQQRELYFQSRGPGSTEAPFVVSLGGGREGARGPGRSSALLRSQVLHLTGGSFSEGPLASPYASWLSGRD